MLVDTVAIEVESTAGVSETAETFACSLTILLDRLSSKCSHGYIWIIPPIDYR